MTTATVTIETTVEVTHSRQACIRCVAKCDLPQYGLVAGQRFHLVRKSGTTYTIKAITVLSRQIRNGSVTCQIRNGEEKVYTTTLRTNKHHTCSCAATSECYHIELLKAQENDRAAKIHAARVAARKPINIAERGTLNGNRSPMDLIKAA